MITFNTSKTLAFAVLLGASVIRRARNEAGR